MSNISGWDLLSEAASLIRREGTSSATYRTNDGQKFRPVAISAVEAEEILNARTTFEAVMVVRDKLAGVTGKAFEGIATVRSFLDNKTVNLQSLHDARIKMLEVKE